MPRLTHKRKTEYFPIIVERDGYKCFYCEEGFTDNHPPEYDHLNDNPEYSRVENIVLSHRECNNRKKFYTDWQIKAHEKLEQNERAVLACERKLTDTGTTEELTSSQAINQATEPIARQWLEEHLLMEPEINLRDGENAMVNLCRKQTGFGSQSAIRRFIESWANPYNGHLTLSKNENGKTVIRRRTEN